MVLHRSENQHDGVAQGARVIRKRVESQEEMSEDRDDIFSAFAMLLIWAENLLKIRSKLAPVTEGRLAVAIVVDDAIG